MRFRKVNLVFSDSISQNIKETVTLTFSSPLSNFTFYTIYKIL